MGKKTCRVCNKNKDAEKDFYKTSGRTCKECKSKLSVQINREHKSRTDTMLLEILETQHDILTKLETMEEENRKLRKAFKKLSTNP